MNLTYLDSPLRSGCNFYPEFGIWCWCGYPAWFGSSYSLSIYLTLGGVFASFWRRWPAKWLRTLSRHQSCWCARVAGPARSFVRSRCFCESSKSLKFSKFQLIWWILPISVFKISKTRLCMGTLVLTTKAFLNLSPAKQPILLLIELFPIQN